MRLPERRPRPDDPRARILAQHRTLRRFLENAIEIADAVLGGDEVAIALLSYTVLGLHAAFERHMVLEETIILPVLEAELPMGPERIARWRRQQRLHMNDLSGVLGAGAQDAAAVADVLRKVAADVLLGMIEEERTLLSTGYFRRPRADVEN